MLHPLEIRQKRGIEDKENRKLRPKGRFFMPKIKMPYIGYK